jgi:hypothetical protein
MATVRAASTTCLRQPKTFKTEGCLFAHTIKVSVDVLERSKKQWLDRAQGALNRASKVPSMSYQQHYGSLI